MRAVLLSLIVLIAAGCSSKGFNRGELKKQVGIEKPVTTDEDIAKALKNKANLPKPFKLAIYYKDPIQQGALEPNWRWTQEDKDIISKGFKELQDEKVISDIIPVNSSIVSSEDIKSIRLAAAKHGADAILIISGVSDIDRFTNNLAWTYALILPVFFVNGSEAKGLFYSNASLWDVRNEFLYLTAEAEGLYSDTHSPISGPSDKEISKLTKEKALPQLQNQINKMIQGK